MPQPTPTRSKTRECVRALAEVYTHKRKVDAMLDLVADVFPGDENPGNTDRKFLEPAAGSGNFLEEILRRKLAYVTVYRYRQATVYEHRVLRALASIYAIDIDPENVQECKDRLRAVINSHLDNDSNTRVASEGFATAADVILGMNIVCADALKDVHAIEFVDYQSGPRGTFVREWSTLASPGNQLDLFGSPNRDEAPVHYSQLASFPRPISGVIVAYTDASKENSRRDPEVQRAARIRGVPKSCSGYHFEQPWTQPRYGFSDQAKGIPVTRFSKVLHGFSIY